MLAWNYANPYFLELKYEDLIIDVDLRLFQRLFEFLGFEKQHTRQLLEIAYANSLFSGQVEEPGHIRSGESRQWQNYFTQAHHQRFVELFKDALIRLGYEKDGMRWRAR